MLARLISIVLLSAATLGAQTSATRPAPVASVEGISEYRLPNGLRVLLFPDPTKSTITVNITYLAGARHENYGETGMAHLIEHLVSFGSPRHPDAKNEQQERGARRNATTSMDRTNYFETFPASDANLDWALDLEADRMLNAPVTKDTLTSQMTVVRNEMEAGENNPLNALYQRVMSSAFQWHNYAKSTIGARSDVENVTIDRLQAYYKKYYQPDNAILIVTGKFDEQAAIGLVVQKFGSIPRPSRALDQTYTVDPAQDGERSVTVERAGDVQAVLAAYHVPARAHPDFAAVELLGQVLGGNPSGRLYKALVEPKKAATVASQTQGMLEQGVAAHFAIVRQESSITEARTVMLATLDALAAAPPAADEVERARNELLRQIELVMNNSEQVAMLLSEHSASGDWRLIFLNRDRLSRATVEDVRRVAAAYFKPSNRTVGVFVPSSNPVRAEIPRPGDIAAMVGSYKSERSVARGETFDPSAANIETRTVRAEIAPGLKLSMVPKKTRGATVSATLRLSYGDEASLRSMATVSGLTSGMLSRGTTKRTRQQIRDEMNRLRANINVGGAGSFANVSVQTVRDSLPDSLRLVAEMLRSPSFPADEFEQLRQERLAGIETARSEPQQMTAIALSQRLNPFGAGDIRSVMSMDEQIAALKTVSLDQVKAFHVGFYGASNAELAIVGDFDAAEIQTLAADLFGTWKSPKPFAEVPRGYREVAPFNQSLEAPDKANASVVGGMRFRLSDQHRDYPAMVLANYMLGGHSTSRLYTRIRTKDGLSYSVGSQLVAQSLTEAADFLLNAITAPQNASKVEAAMKEELGRALKDGFPADEVAGAKNGWLQSQNVSRSQDPELAARLLAQRHLGRSMEFDLSLQKAVEALTPEDIVAALRRHLDVARISFVKAGDFKKAGVTP